MDRLTQTLLPTERQPPADAEAISHQLMVRAGLVRQVGAGLWTWLPAGLRVHRKVEQIIREEMQAIGCQELLMPVLQPAELWRRSGRYDQIGQELFRLKDRKDSEMVLAMTHEEAVTSHVAQMVKSYRDLPLSVFQLQLKERDEPRPRAGVLRTREFIMKDAYSFDRDEAGMATQYELMRSAYAKIYTRSGLRWYEVESDTGMMGGKVAHEYMAPCAAGEDTIAVAGDYRANLEVAKADASQVTLPIATEQPELAETPNTKSIADVCKLLKVDAGCTLKAFPVVNGDGQLVLLLLRGDHQVNELKLAKAFGLGSRQANPDEIEQQVGPIGFCGPIGLQNDSIQIFIDEAVKQTVDANPDGGWVVGANQVDKHLTGVQLTRDFTFELVDVRDVVDGDLVNGQPITLEPAIEIGNIFQLGTRYSEPMGAKFLDESGVEKAAVMGCYGIGPARVVASAVEQLADEAGICWPKAIAPYQIHVVSLGKADGEEAAAAADVAKRLTAAGYEVLFDDRDAGVGQKMKDAELLGCPLRLAVGKRSLAENKVEVVAREGLRKIEEGIDLGQLEQQVETLWQTIR